MAELGIFETIYSTRSMRRLKPDPLQLDVYQLGFHAKTGEVAKKLSDSIGICGWNPEQRKKG